MDVQLHYAEDFDIMVVCVRVHCRDVLTYGTEAVREEGGAGMR